MILSTFSAQQVQALCTPTSATLCISGDDNSTAYVGGTLIGAFNYAGAPGTNDPANPTCMSVPTALLTGTQVCLAVETQNTAPNNNYSSWDLDITCSGGNHSEITSSGSGISEYYISFGNPSTPPANDSSGNAWYSTAYDASAEGFTTSYCSSGVTASIWAAPLFNPLTGQPLSFIANNCGGDYSSSNSTGALFWKQCTTIPAPTTLMGPPSFTLTKSQGTASVNGTDLFLTYTIIACNTGGAVTNGSVTIADSLSTNSGGNGANPFQFVAWGYGSAGCPFTLPYYNACGIGTAPTDNGATMIFGEFGNGCATMTVAVEDYYWPAGACITVTNNALLTYPGESVPSNTVTFIQACIPTSTTTPTLTNSPTLTPTVSASNTPIITNTPTLSITPTLTKTPTPSMTSTYTSIPGTPTSTLTSGITLTLTPTMTLIPTDTSTPMVVPSTPTPSIPTATSTLPISLTMTPTIYWGSKPVLFPNPAKGPTIQLFLNLLYPSDAELEIYTSSYRKVREVNLGLVSVGEPIILTLVDNMGTPLSDGLYFVVVKTSSSRTMLKLLILR